MATIPSICVNNSQIKKAILDDLEDKIMKNKKTWTQTRVGNLLLNLLVEAEMTNCMNQSKREEHPQEYLRLVHLFKIDHKEFTHELLAPMISVQLKVGEIQGKQILLDEEELIQHSNSLLCNMVLGGIDTSSSFCENYDKISDSIFEESISEGRFQDLGGGWDTYDRCEIPRNFVNIKNMIYYECCGCNQEIYSQPCRSTREESMCLECWNDS
tara:strand:- start:344 stop:982 length:639 start_codon:yes stop_codon:yes gene_type:complete